MWRGRPRPAPCTTVLERCDVGGVRALGALPGVIRDRGAPPEALEAPPDECAVADEEILRPLVRRDEAEALVVAEPLDGSGCHVAYLHGVVCTAYAGEALRQQLRALGTASPDRFRSGRLRHLP